MNCPKCYTKIPDNQASCERCGWPDLAEKAQVTPATPSVKQAPNGWPDLAEKAQVTPAMPSSKQAPSMPMTGKQRWYHFVKALFPLLFGLVPVIGIFTLIPPKNFTLIPLLIVIGLIIAATYFNKHLHDLVNSVVYVESDQLLKVDRFYGHRGIIIYMAFFKRLGSFRVDQELYNTVESLSFYRIMYSPKSRKLWKMKLESNQAIIDNVLSEKISHSSNKIFQRIDRLSISQRKEIIEMMLLNVGFGMIVSIFAIDSIKRLILDNATIFL